MQWETVIGIETHIQLSTKSKIFSSSSTKFGAPPNTQVNSFDLGLPGVLPVLNRSVVEKAIQFCLAINGTITQCSIFERKNYFYPDLPKGYQISQLKAPLVQGGKLSFILKKNNKIEMRTIKLIRAHLEEDAGKSLHENYQNITGIDFNRAGIPLLEIVTEPNIHSAAEAIAYAKTLHSLVMWLNISDGNMENGSFRCDINVSIRLAGDAKLGVRCEIKNLNSFRFIEDAINYEVWRQTKIIENGGIIIPETCLYDSNKKETRPIRCKETEQDYRYFPDPDLLPLIIESTWINQIKSTMPELPNQIRKRFIRDYALSEYDAMILTQSKELVIYFEALIASSKNNYQYKLAANWLIGEVTFVLNKENTDITCMPVSAKQLSVLLCRISDGTISNKIAKEIFSIMWKSSSDKPTLADDIINTQNFQQISNDNLLKTIIDEMLINNKKLVKEFYAGKKQAINAMIGKVMKITKGKANPIHLAKLLHKKLLK